ncbi:MAG: apolipoprotein N-acyltransferase [Salaquimonas sp.]|nr:apolipoprotein N-acyltransferase [Salaquimonas sp.]
MAAAFVAGALSALAMPPFYAFPILFVTLPVLVWLMDATAADPPAGFFTRFRRGFVTGWVFGFGYFLAGLWWVGDALLVEADQYAWMLPFALTLLPGVLAVFWGVATGLAVFFWSEGWPRLLVLSGFLALGEFLRGTMFTGFPWNTIGYAAMPVPCAMQSAALLGLYGVTVLALPAFSLLALRPLSGRGRTGPILFALAMAALVLAHLGYGATRLSFLPTKWREGVTLRIVQPDIDQAEKWSPDMETHNFQTLIDLSSPGLANPPPGGERITHIIWPESSFPFVLTQRPDALTALAQLIPDGTMLIAGALRTEPPVAGDRRTRVFNSIYTINDDGEIVGAADKVHLVPFGEYLPLREWAEAIGIRQLTHLNGDFEPGTGRLLLDAGKAGRFLPLICYEIIFPGSAVTGTERPDFIVNVTNDAWYGITPGPYQHWHQAILRGVEEGLPVVRAANNGISSVTDAMGRTVALLGLGQRGVIDAKLPMSVPAPPYVHWGNLPFFGICAVFLLVGAIAGRALRSDSH